MNRLDRTFQTLKRENRKALLTFTMAGDPNGPRSLEIMHELSKSADILELGMPFSDPMADGPVIQAAGLRALQQGMSIKGVLEIVQQFRSNNTSTPLVLMGYINPLLRYGIDNFACHCSDLGVDGIIIVDLPPEQGHEIGDQLQQNNLALIRLVTPTSTEDRLNKILDGAGGFIYYVSITGVTGTAKSNPAAVGRHIEAIKSRTDLPVIAGFGIKTPDDAMAIGAVADGVVVGSALVETIAAHGDSAGLIAEVGAQATALAAALRG